MARTLAARDEAGRTPALIKIAPRLTEPELDGMIAVALKRGVDGLVISNTTISREGLASRHAAETGGLSGRPLSGARRNCCAGGDRLEGRIR